MKKASITETKNSLSALLDLVKQGESVLIMDRNRPVARLEPVGRLGFEDAQIEWVPKNKVALDDKNQEEKVYKFLEALEDIDDVQNVYANLG